MNLIDKLIAPKKMLLVWQAPSNDYTQHSGPRFIVGEITSNGADAKLRYYDNQDVKAALEKGFNGLTAYPYKHGEDFNGNLIDILSKRLPPSSRGDYGDYLRSYRISPEASGITILSLLAYTAGRLEGDGFSFVHAFEGVEAPFEYVFEIAGFRHNEGMNIDHIISIQNKEVTLIAEKDNKHDKDVVFIQYKDYKLGYVPKGLNVVLKRFMNVNHVNASITKVNGTTQNPSVLVYLKIS